MDEGRIEEGTQLAQQAQQLAAEAGDAREEVLAWLVLARIPVHATRAITQAHAVADEANEPGLITAVAHAARAAGVDLPVHIF